MPVTLTHPDLTAMLRACAVEPAKVLVLADMLDDHGDRERAEYIRVQCELGKVGPTWDVERETGVDKFINGQHYGGGEVIIDDVLAPPLIGSRVNVRVVPKLTTILGMRVFAVKRQTGNDGSLVGERYHVHVKKDEYSGRKAAKKIIALRSREAELLEAHGGEWVRPIEEAFGQGFSSQASFDRGLLHIEAPLAVLRDGLRRMGNGAWWVGSCRPGDKQVFGGIRLMARPLHEFTCGWQRESATRSVWDVEQYPEKLPYAIPDEVFDLLEGMHDQVAYCKRYPTPDLAHAALSRAILTEARGT